MSNKFWFSSMKLHKSPGFSQGTFPPVEQLSEGLNIIWGPNGVGKSTLCRALRSMIWETDDKQGVEAEAQMEAPESAWNISLSQGVLHQIRVRDNQEINLPGRNDELSESYWFPLHELLQEEGKGSETFLNEVRKRMQGGVDLKKALLQAQGVPAFSSSRNRLAYELKQAKDQFESVKKTQLEQSESLQQMEELKKKCEQEDSLASQHATMLQAKRLCEIKDQIDELSMKLSVYPKEINQVNAISLQRFKELSEYVEQAEKELEELNREKQNLENEFAACKIDPTQLEKLDFPHIIQSHFAAYEKSVQHREDAQEKFEAAYKAVQTWEDEHTWLLSAPPQNATLKSHVDTLNRLASECEPLRCAFDAQTRVVYELGTQETVLDDEQTLSNIRFKLLEWMEAFSTLSGISRTKEFNKKAMIPVLLVSLALGVFGLFGSSLFSLSSLFVLIFSFLFFIPKASLNPEYTNKEQELKKKQEGIEELLRKSDECMLSAWTYAACKEFLQSIDQRLLELQQIKKRNALRVQAQMKLEDARKKLAIWKDTWKEAAQALGLLGEGAVLEGSQFFHFSQHLIRWNELIQDKEQAQALLASTTEEEASNQKDLQEFLSSTSSDYPTLQGEVQSLVERFKKALELQKTLRKVANQIGAKQAAEEKIKENLSAFWEKTGLREGDEEKLGHLVSLVPSYETEQRSKKIYEKEYELEAKKDEAAFTLSLELTKEAIDRGLVHLKQSLEEIQKAKESLARMEGEFSTLNHGTALAQAQFRYEEAQEQVEQLRKQEVASRMVFDLAQELQEESETRYQPEVLKQASTWLEKITNHRYTLSANASGFFAHDTIKAKNHTLDELSSGTRVQLLFSLRMAFIDLQERSSGVSLPIFLDELLANSDDERSLSIVQAMHAIANDRQVFYFTAQKEEVDKLKSCSEGSIHEVSLQDVQTEYTFTSQPFKYYTYEKPHIPEPVEDYNEYGRICSVSGINVWEPIESLHSYYLCTRSEELHSLLLRGLPYAGQVREAELEVYKNRIRLLKLSQEEAKRGRYRYLTIHDVSDAGLLLNRSAAYWKKIEEFVLADKVTGNDLLQAIDEHLIPRFSDDKREILANWLYMHDFAGDVQAKSKDAILAALQAHDEHLTVISPERVIVERYLDGVLEDQTSSTAMIG
ncbi:MAG: AAA family ATPase [Sphaerochaeta sp.]